MKMQPPTTMLLIGIWSVARMQFVLSMRNLSMRSDKSHKLQGPNTIQVLALAHTSRKPDYWKYRT
jgi:hypothetical protein